MSASTEQLLANVKLPPRPNEITDDYEMQALEEQFKNMYDSQPPRSPYRQDSDSSQSSRSTTSSDSDPDELLAESASTPTSVASPAPSIAESSSQSSTSSERISLRANLRHLHANLEQRLQPFWASVLGSRIVRLHVFSAYPGTDEESSYHEHGPIQSKDVLTAADGSFQIRFTLDWETLCNHPGALHIAFGEPNQEYELLVAAELLPLSSTPTPTSSGMNTPSDYEFARQHSVSKPRPIDSQTAPSAKASVHVPISHSNIRVISDIDDTVKFSNILGGAREVFRNVFVRDLRDLILPGVGDWYTEMFKHGVRFHYVVSGLSVLPFFQQ
jgi:hypothetical protein